MDLRNDDERGKNNTEMLPSKSEAERINNIFWPEGDSLEIFVYE